MSSADNLAAFAAKVGSDGFAEMFGLSAAVFTTAGAASWTCPAGVTRAKATVIGGGNGGASGSGGAGGGGAVAVSGSNQSGGAGAAGAVIIEY